MIPPPLHATFHLRNDQFTFPHPISRDLGSIALGGESKATSDLALIGRAHHFRLLASHCLTLADQLDALSAAEGRHADSLEARRAEKQAADLEALKAKLLGLDLDGGQS